MYNISTKTDKPDLGYMEATVDKLMTRGIKLSDYNRLMNYYTNLREALRQDFTNKYGVDNPNSPKQLIAFISRLSAEVSMGSKNDIIEICYDDETGKWTSNKDAMEKLAALGYQFAQDLLDYRYAKSYAQAIESLDKYVDENNTIHPKIELSKTHRINYSEPALMSIPKKLLWKLITAYTPGNVLFSVDIKNQEPSILANLTDATELKEALESKDGLYESLFKQCFKPCAFANVLVNTFPEDRVYSIDEIRRIGTISPAMYSAVRPQTSGVYYNGEKVVGIETVCLGGSKGVMPNLPDTVNIETESGEIVNVPVEWEQEDIKYKRENDYQVRGYIQGVEVRIEPIERKEFKTSYLAISYGASVFTIKEQCKHIDGKRVYQFVTGIKAIKEYKKLVNRNAEQGIQHINTVFGTTMCAGVSEPSKLKRVLLDLPIQGTGADILSLLIKRFYDYTAENNLTDKISLYYTRHDELIVEVNGEWLKEVGKTKVTSILMDMLEHRIDDWIPFKIEINMVEETADNNSDLSLEEDD